MREEKVEYREYIDVANICIKKEGVFRYCLYIPYKEDIKSKDVVVIMKNPSKATTNESDRSINNVLEFCHGKYRGVYIANIYPKYQTESLKLKKYIKNNSKHLKNNCYIRCMIQKVDDIIIAWGSTNYNSKKYDEDFSIKTAEILNLLEKKNKNIYAMKFISSQYPWHPLNWKKNFNLQLYKWESNDNE